MTRGPDYTLKDWLLLVITVPPAAAVSIAFVGMVLDGWLLGGG